MPKNENIENNTEELSDKLRVKEQEYRDLLAKIKKHVDEDESVKNLYSDDTLVRIENSEIINEIDDLEVEEKFSTEKSVENTKKETEEESKSAETDLQRYEDRVEAILSKSEGVANDDLRLSRKQGHYDDVVLEVLGLTKKIGRKKIVDDVSFEINAGEIVGLLGPNGAGKTSIMKMLVGLTKSTDGDVYLFEKELRLGKTTMLKEVGSMIESPEFYNYLSGYANLKQIARLCGKKVSTSRIKEIIEFVGLEKVAKKKVQTYSLGMRQRLGLAQALLHEPRLLILDEPVNGLDPQGVQDFRNKLREIAAQGTAILISSHLLDEIEKVSDRIIVIEKGRVVADDSITNLVTDETNTILVTSDNMQSASLIEELGMNYVLENDRLVLPNISKEDKANLVTYLVNNDIEIDSLYAEKKSLEDRFLEITGKGGL